MFKRRGARRGHWLAAVFALGSCWAVSAQAAVVSQWNQNPSPGTVWGNNAIFSSLYSAAFATGGAGHTLEVSAEAISAAALANNTHFVVNSSSSVTALSTQEYTDLVNWVRGGGILILFANVGNSATGITLANNILNELGSTIDVSTALVGPGSGSGTTGGKLIAPDAAVLGGPFNLGNQPLSMYQANVITGGTLLAADGIPNPAYNLGVALRVDTINLGKVYVFGDHFESNFLVGQPGSNLQFFLNVLAQGTGSSGGPPGGGPVPEPSAFVLTAVGIAGLAYWKRRR
jgi:hypothetical protein